MNGTKWLTCFASKGQFQDEFAVRGKDYQDESFSLIVPRPFVKCDQDPIGNQEVSARLKIDVLAQEASLYLVRLPGRTFENGSTVTVSEEQLEDCPTPEYV